MFSKSDVRVGDNPLFFRSNFHQSQLFDLVVLGIVNANGGSSTINSQSGTNKRSSSLSLKVFGLPNTVDGANREVAINDRASINRIPSNKVRTIFVNRVELRSFFRGSTENNSGGSHVLENDIISFNIDIRLQFTESILGLNEMN